MGKRYYFYSAVEYRTNDNNFVLGRYSGIIKLPKDPLAAMGELLKIDDLAGKNIVFSQFYKV